MSIHSELGFEFAGRASAWFIQEWQETKSLCRQSQLPGNHF